MANTSQEYRFETTEREIPFAFMFSPDVQAEQVKTFIEICRELKLPLRYWYNQSSHMMIIAALCPDRGEKTGGELYETVLGAEVDFESVGLPSLHEIGSAKSIPGNWDIEIRKDTLVFTLDGQYRIFSPEGASMW